jgi:hypothetical protein
MQKILPFILALGGLAVFATGCGTDHAKVRFVHASPDANGLDVAVDGKTVATNMAFGDVFPTTDYLAVAAGNRRVEVRDTGKTNDEINSVVDFGSQKTYTLLVSGKIIDNTIAAVLKTDDNSAPPSGNVKLRFIHDAPDANVPGPVSVDVYIVAPGTDITGLSPTIASLGYQQASNYQTLPAATYEVIVTVAGDPTKVLIPRKPYDIAAGEIRTLVSVDVAGGGNISPTPLVLSDLN